jgi:hypothetical protein
VQAVVVRGTDSFLTLLLRDEQGVVVPSDGITRCDLVMRRPGMADVNVSSADLPGLFVLQQPYVYGGQQINVVSINLATLTDPPPDGRCEAVVLLFDAGHPNGEFCGVIGFEFVPGHIIPGGPAPTITSLVPDTVFEDGGPETITVNGTDFVLSSVAQFDGSPRTTLFVSATELEVTLNAADTETVGTFDIQVSNSGSLSNTLPFEVEELGPPLNLTNRTISRAAQAVFALGQDAEGLAASGGNSIIETFFDDEYILTWQSGGPPGLGGTQYEVRWSLVSGTLDFPPSDESGTPLPENTWSFSEWASAYAILQGVWFSGFFQGPAWIKNTIGTCVIQIDIQRIDLTDGPVSAEITLTRSS